MENKAVELKDTIFLLYRIYLPVALRWNIVSTDNGKNFHRFIKMCQELFNTRAEDRNIEKLQQLSASGKEQFLFNRPLDDLIADWETHLCCLSTMAHLFGTLDCNTDEGNLNELMSSSHRCIKSLTMLRGPTADFTKDRVLSKYSHLNAAILEHGLKTVILRMNTLEDNTHVDMVKYYTEILYQWAIRNLSPLEIESEHNTRICQTLSQWENCWVKSKLEVFPKLTKDEIGSFFRGTRCIVTRFQKIVQLSQKTENLIALAQCVPNYYEKEQLVHEIGEGLLSKLTNMNLELLMEENSEQWQEFVAAQENYEKLLENRLTSTVLGILEKSTLTAGLQMIIDMSWTYSGELDNFLRDTEEKTMKQLMVEVTKTRQELEVTDFLEKEWLSQGKGIGQRIYERRLLFHRIKCGLLSVFPNMADWDKSPSKQQLKAHYIELSRYLKVTEEKFHHGWFQNVQNAATSAMTLPVLQLQSGQYNCSIPEELKEIFRETRLFSELNFRIPQICEMLLDQEELIFSQCCSLQYILKKFRDSSKSLNDIEMSVLRENYDETRRLLDVGCTRITWSSLFTNEYVANLSNQVKHFASLAININSSDLLLKTRIESLQQHRLVALGEYHGQDVSYNIMELFEDLRQSGDNFYDDVSKSLNNIRPIMLQVESLICNTETGTAQQLKDFYNYWADRSYIAIFRAIVASLEEFHNILKDGPSIFNIDFNLDNHGLVLNPTVELLGEEIRSIVDTWIKKSELLKSWGKGTCRTGKDSDTFRSKLLQEREILSAVDIVHQEVVQVQATLREEVDWWLTSADLWGTPNEGSETLPAKTLLEYDPRVKYLHETWRSTILSREDIKRLTCLRIDLRNIKAAALQQINCSIERVARHWLQASEAELRRAEGLLQDDSCDGSNIIDVEIILNDVKESWDRLTHYGIQVPGEMIDLYREVCDKHSF